MATEYHELDSQGDVLLMLRNPRPPFAVWDETQDHPLGLPYLSALKFVDKPFDSKRDYELPPTRVDELSIPSNEPPVPLDEAPVIVECIDDVDPVGIRVSSRHLALASPYFRDMFKGEWREAASLRTNGSVEVEVKDIDADALVILMKIIHGKTRTVPRVITLEMLAKIAVLVDLYRCYEAVEVFTEMWIANLNEELIGTYSRDTVLWICICWVFRQHDDFYSATLTTLKYSSGPIQSLGLPILQRIVDDIDKRREDSIERVFTILQSLRKEMINGLYGCSLDCNCKLLGALVKATDTLNLTSLQRPYAGLNFADTLQALRNVPSPGPCPKKPYQSQDCSLTSCMRKAFKGLDMDGLELEGYGLPELS